VGVEKFFINKLCGTYEFKAEERKKGGRNGVGSYREGCVPSIYYSQTKGERSSSKLRPALPNFSLNKGFLRKRGKILIFTLPQPLTVIREKDILKP
jgi:hypothetical protein